MSSPEHTVIVGGGIVGLSTAWYLARRGHRVTIIERDGFDTGASTGNAGIIALGHPPLPRPGLIAQTMKLLLKPTNPVFVAARLDPSLWRWMLDFKRACRPEHLDHCMDILNPLGRLAGEAFREMVDDGIEAEYQSRGWIEAFRTTAAFTHGQRAAELTTRGGFDAKILSPTQMAELEPAFTDEIVGGIHWIDSGCASPGQFVVELARRVAELGVDCRVGAAVESITMKDDRFESVRLDDDIVVWGDRLVLAAGVWTTALARSIGIHVPMQPGKGYHINLDPPDPCPTRSCVLAETFVAVTPMDGGLRLAGTVELSGLNHTMRQRRLDMLRVGARRYIRGLDDLDVRSTWCGLRPCTADGLPAVGWAPGVHGVAIATGHAMMGFALGPPTGRLLAELILDDAPSIDLTPLSPARFVR